MYRVNFDLAASARKEMIRNGFDPDFPPGTDRQIAALKQKQAPTPADGIRDLRSLLWSSIDNDTSRDLDQIEVADRVSDGIRVLVGIADVDSDVPPESPIDKHAAKETVTVYTRGPELSHVARGSVHRSDFALRKTRTGWRL